MYDPLDNEYEDPYVTWARQQQQLTLPGELAKGTVASPPPPPPQQMAVMGAPVVDEVPQGAIEPQHPEPPPMQVDAVSQAAPAAQVADVANVSMEQQAPPPPDVYGSGQVEGQVPEAYLQHMQEQMGHEDYAPDGMVQMHQLPSEREATQQEAANRAVMAMTPEQLALFNAHRESALMLEQARLHHENELANQARAAKAMEIQQAATAKADADMQSVVGDAKRLASTSINPDRYRQNRGVLGEIRDVASIFLSGLGGGPNNALDSFNRRIDRDIAAQGADIENGWKGIDARKGAIHDEYARHGDLYRAAETYRLAAYASMENDIQTQLQMYDPAGANALRGRAALDQIAQAKAQTQAALWQQTFKNTLDYMKGQAEYDEKMANVAKTQAETAKLKGQLGAGKKPTKFEDTPMTLAQLRGFGVQIPDGVTEPPGGISINQAKKLAESGASAQTWAKATRENSPEERARQNSVGEIVDDQGDPVQFRSVEMAGKIADTKASIDTVSQYADEMIDLYAKHGFEPDFLKSEGWRQAQGAFAAALLESKTGDQLGALSGSDLDLEAKKITGGVDVTGLRDPTAALQSFKRRISTRFDSIVRAQAVLPKGRSVKPWSPPNTAASTMPQAEVTPEQKSVEAITAFDPKRSLTTKDFVDLGVDPNSVAARGGGLNTVIANALEKNGGIPPRIKAQLDSLRAMTNDADEKKREFAVQALKNIGEGALDPNVKSYATANAFDAASIVGPNVSKEEVR